MPCEEQRLVEQEESMNDTELEWPSTHMIAKLPPDWRATVEASKSSDKESAVMLDNYGQTGYNRSNSTKKTKKRRASRSKRNNKFDSNRRFDTQSSNTSRSRRGSCLHLDVEVYC